MDSKIGFEMSLIVVEAIRGRCASSMVIAANVSEIFGGQTNYSIVCSVFTFLGHHTSDNHAEYDNGCFIVCSCSLQCCGESMWRVVHYWFSWQQSGSDVVVQCATQ